MMTGSLIAPIATVVHGLEGQSGLAPTIRRAVVAALNASLPVTSIVSTRIFAIYKPESYTIPSLVCQLTSDSPGYSLTGANGTSTAAFRCYCITKHLPDGESLASAVREALNCLVGTITIAGIGSVAVLWSIHDDEADEAFESQDASGKPFAETRFSYRIRYRKPKPILSN